MRETTHNQEEPLSTTEVLDFFSDIMERNNHQSMIATFTSKEGRIEASIAPRTEGSLQRTPPPNTEK
jgi:hypothetical protein